MYFYDYIDKFIDSFNVFTTCISICDKFFVMICIELNPCYRGRTRSRTIFPFTSYPPPTHTHTPVFLLRSVPRHVKKQIFGPLLPCFNSMNIIFKFHIKIYCVCVKEKKHSHPYKGN